MHFVGRTFSIFTSTWYCSPTPSPQISHQGCDKDPNFASSLSSSLCPLVPGLHPYHTPTIIVKDVQERVYSHPLLHQPTPDTRHHTDPLPSTLYPLPSTTPCSSPDPRCHTRLTHPSVKHNARLQVEAEILDPPHAAQLDPHHLPQPSPSSR